MEKGLNYDPAFSKVYGAKSMDLLQEWKVWVKKKNYQEIKGLDPLALTFVDSEKKGKMDTSKGKEKDKKDSYQEWEKKSDQLELSQIALPSVREHLHLGDLLRYRNRLDAAIIEYERARDSVDNLSPVISIKLAKAYLLNKRYKKAEKEIFPILELYPNDGLARRTLADVYFNQERYKEASDQYQKAIYINPFNPLLHANLAKIYDKLGKRKLRLRAEKSLEIILRDRP